MDRKPLPDYCIPNRPLEALDGAVVHYFSAKNVDPDNAFNMHACLDLFKDLNRPRSERESYMREDSWPSSRMYASAHVLIGRTGTVWKLVDFEQQAYHAGASILNGRQACNRWTLGIELVGHQSSGFSREQYQALAELILTLESDHGMPRDNVAGHDHVRWAAIQAGSPAKKKYDPSGRFDGNGDNFDWYYLGKLMNDIKPNPTGTNTLADLDATLAADPNSNGSRP